MKRRIVYAVFTFFILAFTTSCTENSRAKNFGGEAEVDLPKGQKLLNVTWKDNALWYLTRPMLATDSAITYTFHEKSSWGTWEGTYTLHEIK